MLLRSLPSGDPADAAALMEAVYDDMRRIAAAHMRSERPDHTIEPTALIHEVYLKLVDQRTAEWNDRMHFFAFASQLIRRILIDHARAKNATKRGGDRLRVPLAPEHALADSPELDLIALDEALRDLARLDERQARVVELRYFGGCTIDEIAEYLGVNSRTIDRDWTAAKAWLYTRLVDHDGADHEH